MLGLAGGIEQGNADATNGASADIDRAYAGVALKHVAGPWVVAGAVFGGTGSTDTTRPINFGGLVTAATGDQTVSHLSGRLRVAYQMGGNALYAKPMVDVEATHMWLGSVQEQGGPGALSIASSEETVFSAAPAVEIGGEVMIDGGTLVRPFARVVEVEAADHAEASSLGSDALDALYAAVAKALATPEAQAKFKKQNYNIVPSKSVDDAKKWLANELKQWQTITAAVKIEVSP